jgi:hypothetical protein
MIDTFVGIPREEVFKEFINTAMIIDSIAQDEEVIKSAIIKIEEFITKNDLEIAEKMLIEGLNYE